MRACVLTRYGEKDSVVVRERDRPRVGEEDVLIRVKAAGVNPLDWKTRNGKAKALLPLTLPAVLGNEAAGIVEEVGDKVQGFSLGDEVLVRTDKTRLGAFADYLATHASLVAHKPANLSFVEAAALPLVGLTAWQALYDVAKLQGGHRVLIHAGAGGVGSMAVQIAAARGAHVTATASAKKRGLVQALGAREVIDYRSEHFEDRKETYDVILDTVGKDTLKRSFAVLGEGGVLVSIAAAVPDVETMRQLGHPALVPVAALMNVWNYRRAHKRSGQYRYLFMRPDGAQLAKLAALASAGSLRPIVDRTFALEDVAKALSYSEAGHATGKIVLDLEQRPEPEGSNWASQYRR